MKKMAMFVMMVVMAITAMVPMTAKADWRDYLTEFEVDYVEADGVINKNDMTYIADCVLGGYDYSLMTKSVKYAYAPYNQTYMGVYVNRNTQTCLTVVMASVDNKWQFTYISDVMDVPEEYVVID